MSGTGVPDTPRIEQKHITDLFALFEDGLIEKADAIDGVIEICPIDRDKLSKLLDGEKQTQRQSGTNTEIESQIVRQIVIQRQCGEYRDRDTKADCDTGVKAGHVKLAAGVEGALRLWKRSVTPARRGYIFTSGWLALE